MDFVKQMSLLFFISCFVVNLACAERSTYIVHMDKSFMPTPFASHEEWYSNTIDSLKFTQPNSKQQSSPSLIYTYNNVLHGFSALLSQPELEALKDSPGFISAYSDKVAKLDTTHSYKFLSLNQETGLWPASNYGENVIVGVIDTGVWPESRSFRDDGMPDIPSRWKGGCDGGYDFNSSLCNKKLIGAKYFNKGVLAATKTRRHEMYSARDAAGHGTHTSSTVGGNYVKGASYFGYAMGTARGVAPRARLAMYRVIFEEGRYASDVLAGMDQAVDDGVDIISISMGFDDVPLYEDPIAIASFGAMEKGVLVSSSAGNYYTTLGLLHNGIPWVLTVAAGSMDRWFAGTLTLGNGLTITGWSMFPGKASVRNSPLIFNKTLSACNSTELLSQFTSGTIICNSIDSFNREIISQSRVDAAIFITDSFTFDGSTFRYPGVIISSEEGAKVIRYALNGANPTATIEFQQTLLGKSRAPIVAEYTSRGPSPSYPGVLKPDVMAPGTLVLAAWIPNDPVALIGTNIRLSNDFTLESGTSMACPHASGIAALLKGAHPEWSPAAIRSAMVTTANPLDNMGDPIKDIGFDYAIATPVSMGAGQVDPNSALDPGLIYDASVEDYIQLLCSMNYTEKQIATIARSKYKCSTNSSDLNYPSFIALYKNGTKSVRTKRFERIVTNVGDGEAVYKAQVTSPKGSLVNVYPETLVFGQKYDKQSYSLSIKYKADHNMTVTFGSITWVEENGKHTVRSPIVVAPMIPVW
ncbi:OLC1v1016789C1 [Oldenlandia corymbosa var. corymbosa]|uniref:OLC1v1016789C1 n=1 Tax=Oldenlandia corymbosa var. corymbosa TaxID=529605 RepID=A0AAV1E7Z7_OLDCO|nr:OLC1v1016789C1 [Oldenlandia corymbosa var. corymbosa]